MAARCVAREGRGPRQVRAVRRRAVAALRGCRDCGGPLQRVFPQMAVTPDHAELLDLPDEQDTKIVFQITALTLDNIEGLKFKLDDNAPPEFKLDDGGLTEVLGGQ